MEKQRLMRKLIDAMNVEEGATAIYYDHLDALSSRFITDPSFAKKAKEYFHILIEGNKKHKRICEALIKQIQGEDKDDY